MRYLNPPGLLKPRGYTHVVEVTGGRTLYISGQIALNERGELVGKDDFSAQAAQVFENIKTALAAAGATFDHVVKYTAFVKGGSPLAAFREVRNRYMTGNMPAGTLAVVSGLAMPDLLLEVEAIAVVE